MKIISHNINGLKSFMGSERSKILEERADVYCFQEVKCADEDKIKALLGDITSEYYVFNSVNTFKKGYAGVTTLVKKSINVNRWDAPIPLDGMPGLYPDGMSGYCEGRIVTVLFDDFCLLNIYSVNSAGEQKTQDRKLFETYLIKYINSLKEKYSKPIIICGDLNVCSTEYDYWGNYKKVVNSGPGLMQFEIDAFANLTESCNLVDTYRMINGDKREYSWYGNARRKGVAAPWELRHGWKLDYFLVEESIKNRVVSADIYELYQHVDHSPISIEIN